ncbi:hypothetical protein HZY97_14615 [Sphingomonas sp. R-74633]|uniref:tetratricopeptide repeat protein n=1 Tax=Sphingomonas sp. R-74633 TaxID=2751188 RepID=UPI0015D44FD8|nr:hypothetical protein [Sphingomonas sp. R-74633]NYT42000.1 hypothetical protein [Sphingomonas sp. R-74633]
MRAQRVILTLALIAFPALADAQVANPDQDAAIVVQGQRDKPSNWRQAETDHVMVISDGGEKDLTRIAHNLERLHFLLSVLLNRVDQPDQTVKLRVTLVGEGAEFDAMDLRNLRYSPGPYVSAFPAPAYYDPREDGAVFAASRFDQKVTLERGQSLANILPDLVRATAPATPDTPGASPENPGLAATLSASYAGSVARFGRDDPMALSVNEVAVPLSAEGRIYAGYARHFLLTNFPHAYPRWYVDGFGEMFATLAVEGDARIEYGRAPDGYRKVLDKYARMPVADILTGRYLNDRKTSARWTPFHAWALTHMLFFSNERKGQLHAYLATIAAGGSMEQAAAAFGDLAKLQSELIAYDRAKMPYEQMSYPADRAAEPIVRRLSEGEAAFVKGRLELGARVAVPPASDDAKLEKLRQAAIARRDDWLKDLRRDAARYPANLDAQLLLAEAECRSGNGSACAGAADRALALAPGNSDALAWQGTAQTETAIAAPVGQRAAKLKAARVTIARANRANSESPLPLIAYYRSFSDAGETPPDVAIEGLMKARDLVPASPAPRLMLGEALAKRGSGEAARQALIPVANGAYETPEAAEARMVLASLPK